MFNRGAMYERKHGGSTDKKQAQGSQTSRNKMNPQFFNTVAASMGTTPREKGSEDLSPLPMYPKDASCKKELFRQPQKDKIVSPPKVSVVKHTSSLTNLNSARSIKNERA